MNEHLIAPIVERISLGHTKEAIKQEMLAAGYTESDFESAYMGALTRVPAQSVPPAPAFAAASAQPPLSPAAAAAPVVSMAPPVVMQKLQSSLLPLLLKAGGALVVVVLIVGGGYYAWSSGLLPIGSGPYHADTIAKDIAEGVGKINSTAYTISLDFSASPRDADVEPCPESLRSDGENLCEVWEEMGAYIPSDVTAHAAFTGSVTRSEEIPIDAQFALEAELQSADFSMFVDVEAFKKGDDLYGRVNRFPTMFFMDFSGLRGKWVKVTKEELEADGTFFSGFDMAMDSQSEESAEAAKRMRLFVDLADKHHIFTIVGKPVRENIDGTRVFTYTLAFNPDTMRGFMEEYRVELERQFNDHTITTESIAEINSEYITYFNKHVSFKLSARADGVPVKIETKARIPIGKSMNGAETDARQLNLAVALSLANINETITIEPPADALSLEAAMRILMNDPTYSLEAERLKKKDQQIRSSVYFLEYEAELYYDEQRSFKGFCQSERVLNAAAAVRDLDSELSCTADAVAYAIEAKLPSGPYLCFDSAGNFEEFSNPKARNKSQCGEWQ